MSKQAAEVTQSPFDEGRWYVWAPTPTAARAKVNQFLKKHGVGPVPLKVISKGLTRPGSYDYEGNAVDGYKENIGTTTYRYRVDLAS